MNKIDKILVIILVAVVLFACYVEIKFCGTWKVECEEGTFTVKKKFFGGFPVYKESEQVWWLWPEENGRESIICHNCEYKD